MDDSIKNTEKPEAFFKWSKKFNEGGRVSYDKGNVVVPPEKPIPSFRNVAPFDSSVFKRTADNLVMSLHGGMGKDLTLSTLQELLDKAVNEKVITQKEGIDFIKQRANHYTKMRTEHKGKEPLVLPESKY